MFIHKPNLNTFVEQNFHIGSCILKVGEHSSEIIHANGKGYSITVKEGQVLKSLFHSNGEVIAKQELIRAAWGNPEAIGSNSLPVAISNLRKILQPENISIINVPKKGYRLCLANHLPQSSEVGPSLSVAADETATEQATTDAFDKAATDKTTFVKNTIAKNETEKTNADKASKKRLNAWFSHPLSIAFTTLLAAISCLLVVYVRFSWVSVSCEDAAKINSCVIETGLQSNTLFLARSTLFASADGKGYQVNKDE